MHCPVAPNAKLHPSFSRNAPNASSLSLHTTAQTSSTATEKPPANSRYGAAVLKAEAGFGGLLRRGDICNLRASVRVTVSIPGHTNSTRPDRPPRPMENAGFHTEPEKITVRQKRALL